MPDVQKHQSRKIKPGRTDSPQFKRNPSSCLWIGFHHHWLSVLEFVGLSMSDLTQFPFSSCELLLTTHTFHWGAAIFLRSPSTTRQERSLSSSSPPARRAWSNWLTEASQTDYYQLKSYKYSCCSRNFSLTGLFHLYHGWSHLKWASLSMGLNALRTYHRSNHPMVVWLKCGQTGFEVTVNNFLLQWCLQNKFKYVIIQTATTTNDNFI